MKRTAAAVVIAFIGVTTVALSQSPPDSKPLLDQFIAAHPEVVRWVWMGLSGFIAAVTGMLSYFLKRTIDASQVADAALRADLVELRNIVASRAAHTDEKFDELRDLLKDQWERFYREMAEHGKALAQLTGEHNVLAKHHVEMLRCNVAQRGTDRPPRPAENGGGD